MKTALFLSAISLFLPSIVNAYGWSQAEVAKQRCETEYEINAYVQEWRQTCDKFSDTMFVNQCGKGILTYPVCDSMLLRAEPGVQAFGALPPVGTDAWKILHGTTPDNALFKTNGMIALALIVIGFLLIPIIRGWVKGTIGNVPSR